MLLRPSSPKEVLHNLPPRLTKRPSGVKAAQMQRTPHATPNPAELQCCALSRPGLQKLDMVVGSRALIDCCHHTQTLNSFGSMGFKHIASTIAARADRRKRWDSTALISVSVAQPAYIPQGRLQTI